MWRHITLTRGASSIVIAHAMSLNMDGFENPIVLFTKQI